MRVQDEFHDPRETGREPDSQHCARHIDRLVTGDLDDAQRDVLLRWLDAEPARWRRCALAFLEAQAIRESLAEWTENAPAGATREVIDVSAVTEPPPVGQSALRSEPPCLPPRARQPRKSRLAVVAAAALLVAFTLGWAGGQSRQVVDVAGTPGRTGGATIAGGQLQNQGNRTAPQGPSPLMAAFAPGSSHGTPVVRIRTGEGSAARQIILPVAEKPALQDLASAGRQVIPEYVRSQWERQGYRVVEDRRLLPLKLADGRNVMMPFSRVTLNYVGRPSL